MQLSSCPWCGTDIDPSGRSTASIFHVKTHEENVDTERTVTYCANDDCPFSEDDAPGEGIPVVTVDDEVYRTLPTFVIGTIDKFAQLPWNPNARMLFGHVSQRCARHGWRSNDPAARYPACVHRRVATTRPIRTTRPRRSRTWRTGSGCGRRT